MNKFPSHKIDQKGAIPFILLLGIIGIIAIMVIANFAPFKDKFLTSLFPKDQSLAQEAGPGFIDAEFSSNELLVKVKDEVKNKIKENKDDTGLEYFTKKLKEHKVKEFKQLAKKSSKSNESTEFFKWYKITLGGKSKTIKGKLNPKTQQFSSEDKSSTELANLYADLRKDPSIEKVEINQKVKFFQTSGCSPRLITRQPPLVQTSTGFTAGYTVNTSAALPNNYLHQIRFTKLTNATVIIDGQTISQPTTLNFPAGTKTKSYEAKRVNTAAGLTVELVVVDDCGDFTDFAGVGAPAPTATPTPTPNPVPNDPYYFSTGSWGQNYQDLWGIKKIEAEGAWLQTKGSSSIIVADIDTGVDRNHEDIKDNIWVNSRETPNNNVDDDNNGYVDDYFGWDFLNRDNDPMDDNGHGTHTVGTIAGKGGNGVGIVGVNWTSSIMALKFLGADGGGYLEDGVLAMQYAADNGARVSSNSWGGYYSTLVNDAVKYQHDKGMVVVAAAGNSNDDAAFYSPASSDYAITVGATNHNDQKASFSNYGEKIDVAAPGGDSPSFGGIDSDILSARASQNTICEASITVGEKYCRLKGTSMAAPHVSGLAALILAKNPSLTNEEVRQIIRGGAQDLGSPAKDVNYGFGRINAKNSLDLALTKPLTVFISGPITNTLLYKGTLQVSGSASGPNFSRFVVEAGLGLQSPSTWIIVARSTTPVTNGVLASVPTTTLASGYYVIRVTAYDTAGKSYQFQVQNIRIDNDLISGWPKTLEFQCTIFEYTTPAMADIDNNGTKEIITASGNKINAYKKDGTTLAGFPYTFEPDSNFPPCSTSFLEAPYMTINVDDLDGDNKKEIVALTYKGVIILRSDGTPYPGWPKTQFASNYNGSSPAIDDIDGDGKKDLVVFQKSSDFFSFGILHVYRPNGTEIAGFPKNIPGTYNFSDTSMISVFDLDKDGKKEIAFGRADKLYLFDAEGNLLPGWPFSNSDTTAVFNNAASAGDIDGDGKLEIFAIATVGGGGAFACQSWSGCPTQIVGLKKDGLLLSGYPKSIGNNYSTGYDSPAIADLDGDGKDEVVLGLGRVIILDQNGEKPLTNVTYTNTSPAIADFDGDGKLEIVTSEADTSPFSSTGSKPITVIRADGSVYWQNFMPSVFPKHLRPAFVSDLDNNGKIELFGIYQDGLRAYLWEIPNTSSNAKYDWPLYNQNSPRTGKLNRQTSVPTPTPTPNPSPSGLLNGPISYWKMDETGGTTAANAVSATFNATLGSSNSFSAGKINNGLNNPGTSAGATVTYSAASALDMTGNKPMAVSYWLKVSSITKPARLFETVSCGGWGTEYTQTGALSIITFCGYGTNQNVSWPAGTVTADNQWHHYLVSFDGQTATLYKDGVSLAGKPFAPGWVSSARTLMIGGDASYPLYGSIDEVGVWNRALTTKEVSDLYSAGLKSGLVSYWKMDETGGTTISNSVSSSFSGTIGSANTFSAGKFGNSLASSGGSAGAVVPYGAGSGLDISGNKPMSAGFWLKVNSLASHSRLLQPLSPSCGSWGIYYLTDGSVGMNNFCNNGVNWPAGTVTADNNWHYFALTYDGTNAILYKDGVSIGSKPYVPNWTSAGRSLYIGGDVPYPLRGSIDELGIWNRALTTSEVSQLYNLGSGKQL